MKSLRNLFDENEGRIVHKWNHYFEIYESHFEKYRNREVSILEIGIARGGSLKLWKSYFGAQAKIYAIDIDPRCKDFEEEGIQIFIGSQSDRKFLRSVVAQIPKVDILIDDGGHTMIQQIVSFEELFGHIKEDGVYLCEDCHTSYWWKFGGGYRRRGTFIEYSKNWIDKINAFHSKSPGLKVDSFTRSVKSAHFYDSIVVLEKGLVEKPFDIKSGSVDFVEAPLALPTSKKIGIRIRSVWKYISHLFGFRYHAD